MSEELDIEQEVNDVDDVVPELSPIEEKASERGWAPESEWKGDPDEWVDAKTFVRQGELMDAISASNARNKANEQAIKDLLELNKQSTKAGFEQAIKEMKAKRREAREDNDWDAVDALDENIAEAKNEMDSLSTDTRDDTTATKTAEQVELEAWASTNTWYITDPFAQKEADDYAARFVKTERNKGNEPAFKAVLKFVETSMKRAQPELFGKPPSSVQPSQGGGGRSKGKTKFTYNDLSDEQKRVATNFKKSGTMEIQAYVDQLADIGAIK